jgi:hypothetical protein
VRALVEEGSAAAAVRSCVAAAVAEFDPTAQKRYLRAAAYGMSAAFAPQPAGPGGSADARDAEVAELAAGGGASCGSALGAVDPSEFVACCKKLRVLNQVRGAGLPLTAAQFDRLTPQVTAARQIVTYI